MYFATNNFEKDGALFSIPVFWNHRTWEELQDTDPYNLPEPMMITPVVSSSLGKEFPGLRNLTHQMGKFFVAPISYSHIPIEQLSICEGLISKIIITKEAKQDIRNSLGFDEAFIYSHLSSKLSNL